jgi:hypothetical protein
VPLEESKETQRVERPVKDSCEILESQREIRCMSLHATITFAASTRAAHSRTEVLHRLWD